MGAMASQITSLMIVYSTVHSGTDQRKHQSSASLAFFAGNSPGQMASNAKNSSILWRHREFGHCSARTQMQDDKVSQKFPCKSTVSSDVFRRRYHFEKWKCFETERKQHKVSNNVTHLEPLHEGL